MQNINTEKSICSDNFWDVNLTWYSAVPDFTQCFQETVFILIPCLVFCVSAIVILWSNSKRTVEIPIPWTVLGILKIALCIILILTGILKISLTAIQKSVDVNTPDILFYSNSVELFTYVLILIILKQNKRLGISSSTLLSIFWFVYSICNIFGYRSTIIKAFDEKYVLSSIDHYALKVIHFPLILCQFFLSLFHDPSFKSHSGTSFLESASFFSRLTFFWYHRYVYKGIKEHLSIEDCQPLPFKLQASYLWEKFQIQWNKFLLKRKIKSSDGEKKTLSVMLAWIIIKTSWVYFTLSVILQLSIIFFLFIPPLLLDKIIAYVSEDDFAWKGYVYCLALFFSNFAIHMSFCFMFFFAVLFSSQVKTVVISAIYQKAVKLSSSARRQYTSGEMVNLISVDAENVYMMALFSPFAIGAPIKLCIALVFLWKYLGPSCLAGVAVLVLMLLFGSLVAKKTEVVQKKQMKTKDSRMKFMNEILNGIMVLKLYAWELPFMKRISNIRKKEVNLIRKFQFLFVGTVFNWSCGPFFVAIACILTYILVDKKHVLDAATIFVSLNLLNILRYAAVEIPIITAKFIQTVVSLKRLFKFLVADEYKEGEVGVSCDPGEVISIRNGKFSWSDDSESALKNIDFHVPEGSLVAIIGPVGAGKSSLISAILGEMQIKEGSVDVKGTVSYVPQQAWILNRTLRENVLFVNSMDKRKYETVLDNCCLKPDLEILPGGDKTEIGEKGVNLSGGQKQRISLARAVFNDADIYLFDDPLSAVDSHVGKLIFKHVISHSGFLRNKTRILVTHNVSILPETDLILTMSDGTISEIGTYDELMKTEGSFAEFIAKHANFKNADEHDLGAIESNPAVVQSVNTNPLLLRSMSVESTTSAVNAKLVDDENMEMGKVKRKVYINYVKHMGLLFFFGEAFGILCSEAFDVAAAVWLSKWTSDPVLPDGSQDVNQNNYRMTIFAIFGLIKVILRIGAAICLAYGSARASKLYHRNMLHSILRAPMSFFDTTPLGRIINRFGRDIDDVDTTISMNLDDFLSCIFHATGTFIVIGMSTPLFLAFFVPIGVIYYAIQHFYLIASRQLKRLSSITRSPVFSHFTETVNGTSCIRAFRVAEYFIKKANEKLDTNMGCLFYWTMANRWLQLHVCIIGDFVILTAAILAVQSRDILETGVVGLALTYALNVSDDLVWIVRCLTELENRSISIERLEEYSNLPSEAPWTVSDTFPPEKWPLKGKLEFKDYSTRYRKELDLVIKNINLSLKENQKVGIVGRTGAGKSSVVLALFRIIEPVEGAVLIDDVDVSKIGLHQLRSKLTVIPQDPVLFTGSLRMNLDPNSTHSDTELWSSLECAHLKSFASSLSEGLDFDIAEGGSNLSVGQKQLICLARALLKQAKILILDEATAAVDMETDRLIQNTIRTEFKDCTVITIAHRLNTIMDYDKVVVMSAGEITEIGNPVELLQEPNSNFYSMAKDAGLT